MAFQLFTDKKTDFECRIELEGASVKDSNVRMVLENRGFNYLFEGSIDSKGRCKITFPKLKGLFESQDTGAMKLEIIADDVYFQPWQSDFVIETAKKVRVEVLSESEPAKPSVKVKVKTPEKEISLEQKLAEGIVAELNASGIEDEHVLLKHKKLVQTKVRELSEETNTDPNKLIRYVVETLNNKRRT